MAIPSYADWQLQWESNASGTWLPVHRDVPVDSYVATTGLAAAAMIQSSGRYFAQQFQGNGAKLSRGTFWLRNIGTPVTTSLTAYLYASTTAFGTPFPTGAALATSTPVAVSSIIPLPSYEPIDFTFDGTFTLVQAPPTSWRSRRMSPVSTPQLHRHPRPNRWVHTAGNPAINSGGAWSALADRDFCSRSLHR